MNKNIKTLVSMIGLVIFTSIDSYGMLSAAHKLKPSGSLVRFVRCYCSDKINLTPEHLHWKDPSVYGKHYVKPLQDSLFKSIMDHSDVRNFFLETFTKLEVTESEKLDGSMQPLNTYESLRESLKRANLSSFLQDLKQKDIEVSVDGVHNPRLGRFLREMISRQCLLKKAISYNLKRGQLDLKCLLSSGEYATVEVQVAPDSSWDYRAFAYASNAFVHGLERGASFHRLNRVIAINFLERGYSLGNSQLYEDDDFSLKTIPWEDGDHYLRHYQFLDIANPDDHRILNTLDLIQVNLSFVLDSDLAKLSEAEREWILFLRDAQNHTPEYVREHITFPEIKKAYDLSSYQRIPDEIMLRIDTERRSGINSKEENNNYKIIGRKEKKFEIAKKMLLAGMDRGNIIEFTGLSEEELDSLSKKD